MLPLKLWNFLAYGKYNPWSSFSTSEHSLFLKVSSRTNTQETTTKRQLKNIFLQLLRHMPFRLPGNLNGSMAYKKLRHLELEIFCQESYLDEWEFVGPWTRKFWNGTRKMRKEKGKFEIELN